MARTQMQVREDAQRQNQEKSQEKPHFAELRNMNDDEFMEAVRYYGVKAIICEYRECHMEPPVDILLAYLYQEPDEITRDESILLKKAYGWGFIEDVYGQLGVEDRYKISTWGKISGWFGRRFNAYKKVDKFPDHSLRGAAADAGNGSGRIAVNQELGRKADEGIHRLERIKKGEPPENLEPLPKLPETSGSQEAIASSNGELQGEDTGTPVDTGMNQPMDQQEEYEPNLAAQQEAQHLASLSGSARNDNSHHGGEAYTPVHTISAMKTEETMSYRDFIILNGYETYKFKEGITEYRGRDISLWISDKQVYSLKDTDFIVIEDRKPSRGMAFMNKGKTGLSMGIIELSAENIRYSDLDNVFLAGNVGLKLRENAFFSVKGGASVENLRVSSSGVSFDRFDAELEKLDLFWNHLEFDHPVFTMVKSKDNNTKEIAIDGMKAELGAWEMNLSGGVEGAWKIKDEKNEDKVAEREGWVPHISGGMANLKIKDIFDMTLSDINLTRDQLSILGGSELSIDMKLPGGGTAAANLTVGTVMCNFESDELSWEDMKGSADISLGGVSIKTEFEDITYENKELLIGRAKGTLELMEKSISVEGKGIKYNSQDKLTFTELSGEINENLEIFKGFNLTGGKLSITNEQGKGTGGENAAASVVISAGVSAEVENIFSLDAPNNEFSFVNGKLKDIVINDANLNIKNNLIQAESKKIEIHPSEKEFLAKDLAFSQDFSSAGEIEQLKNIADFLNGITVKVEEVAYKEKGGLSFSGFKFSAEKPLKIGGDSTYLLVDLEKNSILGHVEWMLPKGGTIERKGDGEPYAGGGANETVSIQDASSEYPCPEGKPPEYKFDAPELVSLSLNVAIVPGVFITGSLGVGAGMLTYGEAQVEKKANQKYSAGGCIGLLGDMWVGTSLGLSVGVQKLASLTAAIMAKLGVKINAGTNLKMDVSVADNNMEVESGAITYSAHAKAAFDLSANLKAKLLFFKARTLYTKTLGTWELGELMLKGSAKWEDAKLNESDLFASITLGGEPIGKGCFKALEAGSADSAVGELPEADEDSGIDRLLELEAKRNTIEQAILDMEVIWGEGGKNAACEIVSQVKSLALVYDEQLEELSEKIKELQMQFMEQMVNMSESEFELSVYSGFVPEMKALTDDTIKMVEDKRIENERKRRKRAADKPMSYTDEIRQLRDNYSQKLMEAYLGNIAFVMRAIVESARGHGNPDLKNPYGKIVEELIKLSNDERLERKDESFKDRQKRSANKKKMLEMLRGDLVKIADFNLVMANDNTKKLQGQWDFITGILGRVDQLTNPDEQLKEHLYSSAGMIALGLGVDGLRANGSKVNKNADAVSVFGGSEQGAIHYTSSVLVLSESKRRSTDKKHNKEQESIRKTDSQLDKVIEERYELSLLKGKVDSFLQIEEEKLALGDDSVRNIMEEICSEIRERKIKETLSDMQDSIESEKIAFAQSRS